WSRGLGDVYKRQALNQSIVVAQDTADKVKSSASKESEVIVTSAQNRADELISNAMQKANLLTTTAEDKLQSLLISLPFA
ncbi:DivIVA domain-containing protein, partial [Enterococcus sp. S181_ASV_20]|nr:DivIVA domain-containing protein [Enterococcus sp. S181_ASV_20]